MNQRLNGKRVAILVADGFEQVELTEPKQALELAGATTQIISPTKGQVKGWNHSEWGDQFPVDLPLEQARPDDFDALLLPGGVMNPDKLRMNKQAVQFVKSFFEAGKPIAAICHGPWTLASADVVRGRRLTSYWHDGVPDDIRAAGGIWEDANVVVDGNLVTSRWPFDLAAFNREMMKLVGS